jgi:hypothetical protein
MISKQYFSEDSVPRFIEISEKTYGKEEQISKSEFVRNKHMLNPDGKSLYFEFLENELTTGRIAVQFRKAAKGASQAILKNPVDLVSFGNNPFGGLRLYKESLMAEEGLGSSSIYHSSNPNSEIFYRKILKENPIAELSYRAIPLSLPRGYLFTPLLKPLFRIFWSMFSMILNILSSLSKLEVSDSIRPTITAMDLLFEGESDLILYRDDERLKWRFPKIDQDADYKRIDFYKKSDYCGYLIFRTISVNGYNGLVVVDLFTKNTNRLDFWRIHKLLISYAGGKNLVFTVANFENKKMRKQFPFPFLRVPQRFEPQKFPIYSPKESQVLDLNAKSYLTLFDLDVM